ncbi:MAG: hypothetical protein ACI8WB_004611 [Phenylobacterium sp.]|jgi:hypothetical protein
MPVRKLRRLIKGRKAKGKKRGWEAQEKNALGPLDLLLGTWQNVPNLEGRGWNMIALPFDEAPFDYRLLLNQYNETLTFSLVGDEVPNRGLPEGNGEDGDQFIAALNYEQAITQIAAEDSPNSGLAGDAGVEIHFEPGLWLHMRDNRTNDLDIARLSTIPHGDSVLALGKSGKVKGIAPIPDVNGLPEGVPNCDINTSYLHPYKHFHENLFKGLFDPLHPNALLNAANQGVDVESTIVLKVDTTVETGGITNIPFVVRQADAAEMQSTFWIQTLKEKDAKGRQKMRLQYSQVIFLEFFDRRDGAPGRIRWPHVSINTMERVFED